MQVTGNQSSAFQIFSSSSGSQRSRASNPLREQNSTLQTTPSSKRDILFDSIQKSRSRVPTLEAIGTVALFRAGDALRFLSLRDDPKAVSIDQNLEGTSRFQDLKTDRLADLENSLRTLQSRVSKLRGQEALNTRQSTSSQPDVVEVSAGRNSPTATFSVRPDRLAQGDVLVSDEQAAPLGALGLSGSFLVNGTKVAVEATDSLFEIRNKINFGEDVNQNGILDGPEDLNQNNILETYGVAATEFGPGVFVNEDLNGNQTLDPSEDSNNNERLDGGVTETNVIASVRDNRLVLTSLTGGESRIDLQDEDSVLLALGFFEADPKGNPVLKERQFDAGNPPVNLNKTPRKAEIQVNGTSVSNTTNVFKDVAQDATLTVKQTSNREAQIRIFFDAQEAVSQIQSLFVQFNQVVTTLNDVLADSRTFRGDADIQGIRQDLTASSQEKIGGLNQRNSNLEDVLGSAENPRLLGIEVKNTEKNTVQELSLSSIVQSLKNGATLNSSNSERQQRFSSIGIKTLQDDTFSVDRNKLARALKINSEEVLDLFNNPENGILPAFDKQLNRILDSGLGVIGLKRQELSLRSSLPAPVADKLRQFEDSSNLKRTVQNLIAVA